MDRRKFILSATAASTVVLVSSFISACSKSKVNLNECLGEKDSILSKFPFQGNECYTFYTISEENFQHSTIKGEMAYLFSEKGIIVGFTIISEKIENSRKWTNGINSELGKAIEEYSNDYGRSEQWQNGSNRVLIASSGNLKLGVPQRFFYTEMSTASQAILQV